MAIDLKARAIECLETIVNRRNTEEGAAFMNPDIKLIHDDEHLTKEEFVTLWPQMLAKSPDFVCRIKDVVAEGRRVWVFSVASGRLGGGLVDDLHMILFNGTSMIMRSQGMGRPRGGSRYEDITVSNREATTRS